MPRQFRSLLLSLLYFPPAGSQYTFPSSGEKRQHPQNKIAINQVVSALCFWVVAATFLLGMTAASYYIIGTIFFCMINMFFH